MEELIEWVANPLSYWWIMFGLVFWALVYTTSYSNDRAIYFPGSLFVVISGLLVVSVLALTPVDLSSWGDRSIYAHWVMKSSTSGILPVFSIRGEYLFALYCYICGHIMTYKTWFWLTAFIYVFNHIWAAKRLCKDNMALLFLMILCSTSFYAYGVNTIRAGFASSFLILAVSFFDKPILMALLMYVSLGMHFSMAIPIACMIVALYYKNDKMCFYFWLLCIFLSFFVGSSFETFVSQFDTGEKQRAIGYLNPVQTTYKVGFRWDFLAYSAAPVIMGYYYLFKLKYSSKVYSFLYKTYLLTNSFWVLVIRAAFTDRFAYLSWMFMSIILLYPVLDRQITCRLADQTRIIVRLCIGVFLFGFMLNSRDIVFFFLK